MFTLYVASAIASIGWVAFALILSQRDGKTKVLAKYTDVTGSHTGIAKTETNERIYTLQPLPLRTLVIYAMLAILPTLVVTISQTWLAVVLLFGLAVIILVAYRA